MNFTKINELKPYDLNCNIFDVYSYDGLSMQELLCQFFTKINECIKTSNETIDLANWLVNEGLKQEVVEKLMLWLNDGTLENLINVNLFNTLHTKIENINTQLEDIAINITSLGVVMNSDIPQTDKVQNAIDYCIENNKELFIPSGYIVVDDTIYIKNSIRIHGHNSSTYSKLSSNIRVVDSSKDINVFYIEKEDGKTVPAFHLENIYISRKRSSIIDNYNDENVFAHGRLSTAIYAHMDEGSLKNITIVGFKNGVVFNKSQILELNTSDILMCETGIRLLSSFGAINVENNNFCYNKTTVEFDCRGYLFNFNNNHAESALNHFIIINNTSNKLEQINILNNNFTQQNDDTESFLKMFIKGSDYTYSRNIYIENNHLIMYNGNPIKIEYENTISDIDIYMNNNTILCDNPISNENKARIYWNSTYFLNNGSKWSDRSYLTDNIRGIELNNDTVFLNSPLTLKGYDYTKYPTNVKGRMFFDDTRGTISFYNEKQTRLNIPLYMLNTTKAIPTITDVKGGTISQNINGDKGSPLGWVFDVNTQTWNTFGQIGYRSAGLDPIAGGLTPRFIGEEYLDTTNKVWYKSVGVTVNDWVKITVR